MSTERMPGVGGRGAAALLGSWPPVLAWGSGLLLAGIGAGAVVADGSTPLARGIGVGLVTLALLALAWGTAAIHRGAPVAPRAAVAGGLLALLLSSALLLAAPRHTSVLALAVLIVLTAALAVLCVASRRRAHPPTVGVAHLLIAAALIAVLVTPSLAAVQESVLLRSDGTLPALPQHH